MIKNNIIKHNRQTHCTGARAISAEVMLAVYKLQETLFFFTNFLATLA